MRENASQLVVEKEALLKSVEGDTEFLNEVLGIFLADYPQMRMQIRDAVAARDAVKVKNTAHELKGSVSFFGVRDAVQAAQNLESIGKEENLQNVDEAFAELEREMARVVFAFEQIKKQIA
jgi:HPt (histidine-containing phosphotransfer) domain-containing protein